MYGYWSLTTLTSHRLHCKLQARPLLREGALQEEQQSNCQKKGKGKIWSWAPKGSPIPRRTGRLTVGRKINQRVARVGDILQNPTGSAPYSEDKK
jgi:hypothetical protein